MTYRLIAVDLDRTLLRTDRTIGAMTKQAIVDCMTQGIGVTLATGRMYRSALPFAQDLGLTLPLITYQGALLKDVQGRILQQLWLEQDLTCTLIDCLRQSGLHFNVYADDALYLSSQRPDVLEYAAHIAVPPLPLPADINHMPVTQFGVVGSKQELVLLEQQLRCQFGEAIYMVNSGGKFLEIAHPEARKGAGLARLVSACGLSQAEVVAIGDSHNDLDMLHYAGLSVVVENGVPEAKEAAQLMIGSNDADGIGHFLYDVILK